MVSPPVATSRKAISAPAREPMGWIDVDDLAGAAAGLGAPLPARARGHLGRLAAGERDPVEVDRGALVAIEDDGVGVGEGRRVGAGGGAEVGEEAVGAGGDRARGGGRGGGGRPRCASRVAPGGGPPGQRRGAAPDGDRRDQPAPAAAGHDRRARGGDQRREIREALGAVVRQGAGEDRVERRAGGRRQRPHLVLQLEPAGRAERPAAGDQIVEDDRQRVEVGPGIGIDPIEQLGGGVAGGAHPHAVAGERGVRGGRSSVQRGREACA